MGRYLATSEDALAGIEEGCCPAGCEACGESAVAWRTARSPAARRFLAPLPRCQGSPTRVGIWRYGRAVAATLRYADRESACREFVRGGRRGGAPCFPGSGMPAAGSAVPGVGGESVARGEHTPVLLERCLRLIGPALTRAAEQGRRPCMWTPRSDWAWHAEAVLAAHDDVLPIGLDRDPTALACSRATPGSLRRPDPPRARRLRRTAHCAQSASNWTRSTVCCSTSASRWPSNWTQRTVASPMPGRPVGHADGSDHRHHRRRGGQRLSARRPGPDPA